MISRGGPDETGFTAGWDWMYEGIGAVISTVRQTELIYIGGLYLCFLCSSSDILSYMLFIDVCCCNLGNPIIAKR